jgi:serine/threonine protein phosphatase PrpC
VNDLELKAILSANSVDAAADLLVEQALARGAPDNVSLIIVRIG